MKVRTLQDADVDPALSLWQRTEHLGSVERDEVASVRAHDPELVLVAEQHGRLLGVVLGTYDGRRGWIQRLAVDPQTRRAGIARALVEELERRLVDRGCRQANLLVFADNEGGRAFWENVGYAGSDRVALYRRRFDGHGVEGDPTNVGPEDC
jgi:ribosomal protein S18 acetylase RimI-like enzyme